MSSREIKLKSCPCVIEPLPLERNTFVVGCYECEGSNNRTGYLYIIRDGDVVCEKSCPDEGVFDLTICDYQVIAAHSNGALALYDIDKNGEILVSKSTIKLSKGLLTSIDVIIQGPHKNLIVGDSLGSIFIVRLKESSFEPTSQKIINNFEVSIWSVKSVQLEGSNVILVGSDDCSLKGFLLDELNFTINGPVMSNLDAQAGVTSINSFLNSDLETIIIVGSYDEYIRSYKFSPKALNLISETKISGAGVWKVRQLKPNNYLVVGMYSGVHELEGNVIKRSLCFEDDRSIEKKQLIYDAILWEGEKSLLIASFYAKMLILHSW